MNELYKCLLALTALVSLPPGQAVAADHRVLACVGGRVYPSPTGPPIEDAVVLIEDGKISTIAAGGHKRNLPVSAEQIECKDKVIVAGFWNSHVHFETGWQDAANAPGDKLEAHMQEMLTRWGFTTVWIWVRILTTRWLSASGLNPESSPAPRS